MWANRLSPVSPGALQLYLRVRLDKKRHVFEIIKRIRKLWARGKIFSPKAVHAVIPTRYRERVTIGIMIGTFIAHTVPYGAISCIPPSQPTLLPFSLLSQRARADTHTQHLYIEDLNLNPVVKKTIILLLPQNNIKVF